MNLNAKAITVLRGAAVVAMVVALAGCTKAAATQKLVVVTPTPRPTATATPTPQPTPTPTPKATTTATAAPTEAPVATAGSSTLCTGTVEHQAFFAEAAGALKFDVYCAVLSTKWWLSATEYKQPDGGYLTITYNTNGSGVLTVGEGNFCAGAPDCWASASDLGSASFGDKTGSLKQLAGGGYAVFVAEGTSHGYRIIGKGVSQADFVAMAAAMMKVAKS